jgi:hypothetical protein
VTDYRLRIDPWAADYDGSAGMLEGEDAAASVDTTVEQAQWQALAPGPRPGPAPRLGFVDGVRRIDCRFLAERQERTHFGLFGSFAVGAALSGDHVVIAHEQVHRVAAAGGGLVLEPLRVTLGHGRAEFTPETIADDDPQAPLRALQNAMRRAEAALAPELAPHCDVLFVDGPLSSLAGDGPVVGYVKRLLKNYLPLELAAQLPRLGIGERTPLFLIAGAPLDRHSCYLRIGGGRDIDSPWTGVVRCEVAARLGLTRARELADVAARELPRFASDPLRDPRAPQNLFPIGALETRLRHRLGDALLLRRALEAHVAAGVAAG